VPSLVAFGLSYPVAYGKDESDAYGVFDSAGVPIAGQRTASDASVDTGGGADLRAVSAISAVRAATLNVGSGMVHPCPQTMSLLSPWRSRSSASLSGWFGREGRPRWKKTNEARAALDPVRRAATISLHAPPRLNCLGISRMPVP
jgi:hypothetical protein